MSRTPTPDEMAQSWHDFLKRNRLSCWKPCCRDVRLYVMDDNRRKFESLTDPVRDEVWAEMNTYFDAEQAGASFTWDNDTHTWVIHHSE